MTPSNIFKTWDAVKPFRNLYNNTCYLSQDMFKNKNPRDFLTKLNTGSQSENNAWIMSSKFSRICYFWPPYSQDLNEIIYAIWSVLEIQACRKSHKNLEALKKFLFIEWGTISLEESRSIAENFTKCLKLCIEAEYGYLKHLVTL